MQVITETQRLQIRNWSTSDIDSYAKILADPDVMRFIGDGQPKGLEEAQRAIKKYQEQIKTQGWARFAVTLKETGALIGFCGFDFYNGELDFGWRLAKEHWGNGYATEAAKAVFKLGIEKFGFSRIVCIAFEENRASLNVIEKLGIPYEKEFPFLERGIVKQYAWVRN